MGVPVICILNLLVYDTNVCHFSAGRAATLHVPDESLSPSGVSSPGPGENEGDSPLSPSGVSACVTPGPGGNINASERGGGANVITGKGSASAGPLPRGASARKSYHAGVPGSSRPRVPALFKKDREASTDNDALKPRSLR